ncbi:MAG: hypothetical protein KC449_30870, partial [Anaerolineales bacterium]|nr:hypothetical protein [Anaerolineales bacterium]
ATFAEDSSFFAPALMLATAQQRFLAQNLSEKNVVLFLGSAVPRNVDWPNSQELALQLMKEVDISVAASDKPSKLFAFYINRMGNRKRLIQKHLDYFAPEKRPSLYRAAAKLPWKTIFTTNQHGYMEQAYQARGKAFNIQLEANPQNNHHKPNDITIHKLFGSFNISEEDAGPTLLP